jgi:HPt (histidine-containing phosphotransfer) domain-containing protein
MLLRLSRISFWLAATAAAVGLLAPRGHETLLTAIAGIGSALALGLWRSAVRAQRREAAAPSAVAAPELLGDTALADASALLEREGRAAASFEAALHAVARVLRGELGAREAAVHEVHAVDMTHAQISTLMEAHPGFKTVGHGIRLDSGPLGQAIRRQRIAGQTPGSLVIPVLVEDRVCAVIELAAIELAFDAKALGELLDLAVSVLTRHAADAVSRGGPELPRETQFIDTDAQPNRGMAPIGERSSGSAPDEDSCRPFGPARCPPAMLSHLPSPNAAVGSNESSGSAQAQPVLDTAALARLAELDPTGVNKLLERVLQAFQTSVARLRPQADAARLSGDRAALRIVAHTLKSSSASIGAMRLSQLCAQIETLIRQDTTEDLAPYNDALNAALDEALAAIADILKAQT